MQVTLPVALRICTTRFRRKLQRGPTCVEHHNADLILPEGVSRRNFRLVSRELHEAGLIERVGYARSATAGHNGQPKSVWRSTASSSGLYDDEYEILLVVSQIGEIRPCDIAAAVRLDRKTVGRNLGMLRHLRLVTPTRRGNTRAWNATNAGERIVRNNKSEPDRGNGQALTQTFSSRVVLWANSTSVTYVGRLPR